MRYISTISFLLISKFLIGQSSNDTLVPVKLVDSLKREISKLKQTNNFLYWGYHEKVDVSKIDTVFLRSDSAIITYFLSNGGIFKKQFSLYDEENHITQYSIHYYDNKQNIRYIEKWDALKDEIFDARLSSAERIEYDRSGRQILSVTYLQSIRRTIRKTFRYDNNGVKNFTVDIIKSYALWDE